MCDTMTDQNEAAKQQLVSLLKEKRAILMVGAGSSKLAGFPLLNELIDKLSQLTSSLLESEGTEFTAYADLIKDQLDKEGRIREYYKSLDKIFQPKKNRNNHTAFHCALVKLGFCGIITTNYDIVLETAVGEAFSKDSYWRCDPIDLCLPTKPYRFFEFLRSLSPNTDHRWVLHLHGCFDNSERIILTRKDYLRAYGELGANGMDGNSNRILDTIHRKVIWALLVMHSLVFVGFSMKDEFFMKMLEVVRKDFELDSEPVHFAIMNYTSDEDRERTSLILRRKGVLPIFYHVPELRSLNDSPDHSGLERLVFELANSLGTSIGSPLDITENGAINNDIRRD